VYCPWNTVITNYTHGCDLGNQCYHTRTATHTLVWKVRRIRIIISNRGWLHS